MVVSTDAIRSGEVSVLVENVVAGDGWLDRADGNVGIGRISAERVHEYPKDDWNRTIAANAKGVWPGLGHEIPQMLRQESRAIASTASATSLVATPFASDYVISEHAVADMISMALF